MTAVPECLRRLKPETVLEGVAAFHTLSQQKVCVVEAFAESGTAAAVLSGSVRPGMTPGEWLDLAKPIVRKMVFEKDEELNRQFYLVQAAVVGILLQAGAELTERYDVDPENWWLRGEAPPWERN